MYLKRMLTESAKGSRCSNFMESPPPDLPPRPILLILPSLPGSRCDNAGNAVLTNMDSSIYVNIFFNAVGLILYPAKIPEIITYPLKKMAKSNSFN